MVQEGIGINHTLDDEVYEELKDVTIYPSRLNLTHFCSYFEAIESLRKWLDSGIKITAAADGTSALSILLEKDI